MYVRKTLAGAVTVAVTGSVLVLAAGTANAATDDTTFTPTTSDIIGVGSDTSQHALFLLAQAYNEGVAAGAPRLATYAAGANQTIALPSGTVARPNGSGAGKSTLYNPSNPDITFARSSDSLTDAERNAGLQQIPFALDTLKLAVSGDVVSKAPATITPTDMVKIYSGEYDDWSDLGGQPGPITPMIPQPSSGTGKFFIAQLTKANNGVAVSLTGKVQEIQEHDPALIRGNANAVAPFSAGRAGLANGAVRLEGGFTADRALYNVVRTADLGDASVTAIFGPAGFVCSDDATDAIEAAGFKQLASLRDEGVCGQHTNQPTSNFRLNEPVVPIATRTAVTGVSPSAKALRVTARVSGSPVPTGTVQFFAGAASLGTKPLIGGAATLSLTNRAPKAYAIRAVYTPTADSAFVASSGTGTVKVKAASAITETFAASFAKKVKAAKGVVTVKLGGTSVAPTGKVVVKKGAKTVGTGTLRAGKVTLTLAKAKVGKGRSTLKVTWAGDGNGFGSSKSFTVTFKK